VVNAANPMVEKVPVFPEKTQQINESDDDTIVLLFDPQPSYDICFNDLSVPLQQKYYKVWQTPDKIH
jgi:hypothetical protein